MFTHLNENENCLHSFESLFEVILCDHTTHVSVHVHAHVFQVFNAQPQRTPVIGAFYRSGSQVLRLFRDEHSTEQMSSLLEPELVSSAYKSDGIKATHV